MLAVVVVAVIRIEPISHEDVLHVSCHAGLLLLILILLEIVSFLSCGGVLTSLSHNVGCKNRQEELPASWS